jgi:conjugative transfer pilus assembly protein TraH
MPFYGNLVWKALAESGAGLILGSPDTSFSQTPTPAGGSVDPVTAASNEVVMSLLGTQITTQTVAAGGAPVAPAIINNVEQTQSGGFYPHSINLWDLKDKRPSGSELLVWRCQGDFLDTGCQNPVLTKDTTWQGTEGYVNRIMFGQVDDTAGISSGSLLDNLSNCTTAGCSFTAEQTRFIATISAPLLKLLRDVQRDPSAMQIVAQMLAPVMSLELLERYGIAAENAARNAFTGVKNTTMPTHIPARMRELSEQLTSIRLERMKELNKLTNTKEYANLILQNDPSLFARISRGR